MVLLDTCAIVELCKDKLSLSRACLARIEKGSSILSVSFAELALKIKLEKLSLSLSAEELYRNYSSLPGVMIESIGSEEWFDAINLSWNHKDPADRLIVGYAKRRGLPLVTTDKKIRKYYSNCIW